MIQLVTLLCMEPISVPGRQKTEGGGKEVVVVGGQKNNTLSQFIQRAACCWLVSRSCCSCKTLGLLIRWCICVLCAQACTYMHVCACIHMFYYHLCFSTTHMSSDVTLHNKTLEGRNVTLNGCTDVVFHLHLVIWKTQQAMIWHIWKHLASPLETCELLFCYVT